VFTVRYLPFYTLLKKEILRFFASPAQTLLAPLVTSALFLFIFGVNLGNRISVSHQFSYAQFVIPGLVLMGVINNSFQNSSSSLFFSRYLGNIVDILVTPLSASEMILGYTLAAIVRGILVGVATLAISEFFSPLPWVHPWLAFSMAILTAFLMSQLGLIAAIYSDSFEALSVYTNFLLLPLTYLGGMFYPISTLPPIWGTLSHFNPLFYTIDGFRSSILGSGDLPLHVSFGVTSIAALVLFVWAALLINHGHRLRQ
jgi:ABC-2 type transport system permease protein